jgi:HEPN domain-containing protein
MPAPEPRVELTQRWLATALADLAAAQALAAEDVESWVIGFHAQQAIEKALKSILVFEQIEFPRSHDLDRLAALVPPRWRLDLPVDQLARISDFGAETRYPPEGWNDVPPPRHDEVLEAVADAERALDSVVRALADAGVHTPAKGD